VKEVVLRDGFAASALTPDQLLLVVAPPVAGISAGIPEPVGIADLDKLIRAFSMIPGSEDDVAADVRVEDRRLVIDEPGRGCVRLLTASPRTISTRVDDAIVAALLQKVGNVVVPISEVLLAGVRNTFSGLKASEVQIVVGPEGGAIRVGDENSDVAEFPSADLRADEKFELNFGRHLIDVFSIVEDEAILYLGGPGKPVAVQSGDFQYLLSPRVYGADRRAASKATKGASGGGAKQGVGAADAEAEPIDDEIPF
jgi:hypothetical protein